MIRNIFRLNWPATIRINYHAGGMKAVFRMPIKVYGKLRLHVSGRIVLPPNAIRNTLIIGDEYEDYSASAGKAQLRILGDWIIEGIVRVGVDCYIGVEKGGRLEMGDGVLIGRDSEIHCLNHIQIGANTWSTAFYACDSTVHQVFLDGVPQTIHGEIVVGEGSRFNHSLLMKGCRIPPHTVVASGSLVNKDFTKYGENIMLAGIPAQVKHTNIRLTD